MSGLPSAPSRSRFAWDGGRHAGWSRAQRRLVEARVAGAAALLLVGQVAVDMPDGFLGPSDQMTDFGVTLAVGWPAAAAVLLIGLRRRFSAALPWSLMFLALGAGIFVPAVVSDPLVAGAVAFWHLTLIAQITFPARSAPSRRRLLEARDSERGRWRLDRAPAQRHLALVALVVTVAVVGYHLSGHPVASSVCAALHLASLALAAPFLRGLQETRRRDPWLIALTLATSVVTAVLSGIEPALILLAVAQVVLLLSIARDTESLSELVHAVYRRPSSLLAATFLATVLAGTLFLTFPAASADGRPISPLDAFFTATSATCVTGLIVLDTPNDFSPFGHGVILALIQVGGLGIMVISTFAMLILGGNLGLRGEHALSEVLESPSAGAAYALTRFIVLSTLTIEALGAGILTLAFWRAGAAPGEAVWWGVFHSVSAFCNAGFALFSDSLVTFREDPLILGTVGALIVLGGLGFVVLFAFWSTLRQRASHTRSRRPTRTLSVQVKAVVLATLILILAGWALFAALEWDGTLIGLSFADKVSNALFQSVSLRTAGFNSIEYTGLAPATVLVMLIFMFIGASPGSTGGGIKTATLVVLLAATLAIARGPRAVRLFDREVPTAIVFRALAILMASAAIVLVTFFLLLVFEPQPFATLLFEAVSAVGTVGLSLGATAALGPLGKVVIIVAMFCGRIGPLTLALVLGTSEEGSRVRHPRARVMVG